MKKRVKSIRTIIAVIVLGVLIPGNLFTMFLYSTLYNHVKGMVMETQRGTVERYASQWEHQLQSMERYALKVVNNAQWNALRSEAGNHKYELAKIALQREIQDRTSDSLWSQADSICIRIKHTNELLEAHNGLNIPYEDSVKLRQWMVAQPLQGWYMGDCDGKMYICLNYGGDIFEVSVCVKPQTISTTWENDSEFSMEIRTDKKFPTKEGYEIVKVPFLMSKMEMAVYLPSEYINQAMPIQYFLLFCSIAAGFLMIFLMFILMRKYLTIPLGKMKDTIEKIRGGVKDQRMNGCATTAEMEAIEASFNRLMDNIYNLEIKNYQVEIENQKAQLMNLQLQINPHLLLNTLNTIYGLSEIEDYKSIQKFTLNLVKYFRYSLKHIDELVTLKQELDFVKSYVAVQSIRYPDAFYVVYDVEDELMQEYIPPLLIENFVENSAKYSPNKKMTEILVIVRKNEEKINISVCDNGEGIEESVLEILRKGQPYQRDGVTHVGIYNCVRRMKLFYGENMKFSITSVKGEGTQMWLEIPCVKEGVKSEFTVGR